MVLECNWRSTSRHQVREHKDSIQLFDHVNVQMRMEAMIERVWRWTWRPRWSNFGDALGARNWVNTEMHMEATIEWVCRCTWTLWLSEFGHPLGGWDRMAPEMGLAIIGMTTWRSTWRPWLCKLGGLGFISLEIHLEAVNEGVYRCTSKAWSIKIGIPGGGRSAGGRSAGGRSGRRHHGSYSVSKGPSFGPGQFYRSACQWPYRIKNRRFFKQTIPLRPQIFIRAFSYW